MNDGLLFLISIAVSRIGAVLILVFLVQILVSVLRYLLRVAAFYSAKADALELLGKIEEKKFHALALALSPDALNLDEGPKTARERLTGLATQVAKVATSVTKKDVG